MHRTLAAVLVILAVSTAGCGGSGRSPFLAEGRDLYTDNACSTCHGGRGEGGVGPAFAGVAETFASCDEQVEWVKLGSDRWLELKGPTYGDVGKPVKGGMPEIGSNLNEEEVRTVVAYERVDFGGLDEQEVRDDCGV